MSNLFSHLRVSSEYSISQGLLTVDQIVDNAIKHSIPSVALTDRSNMFGLVKFFNKCEAAGIKPISGASIRLIFENDDESNELLCLAKTNIGHKNLMKIISQAHNNNSFNNNSSTNVWRRTILHKNTFNYIYSVFLIIFSNVFYVCVQKMLFNIRK